MTLKLLRKELTAAVTEDISLRIRVIAYVFWLLCSPRSEAYDTWRESINCTVGDDMLASPLFSTISLPTSTLLINLFISTSVHNSWPREILWEFDIIFPIGDLRCEPGNTRRHRQWRLLQHQGAVHISVSGYLCESFLTHLSHKDLWNHEVWMEEVLLPDCQRQRNLKRQKMHACFLFVTVSVACISDRRMRKKTKTLFSTRSNLPGDPNIKE